MASYDPEFYEAPRFSPEYDKPQSRQRGCFFYGCVIACVLSVLLIILLALGGYLAYRAFDRFLERHTSREPRQLPKVQLSVEQQKDVVNRFKAFRQAVNDGTATEPLVLSGDDLNALVEEVPALKGRVFFTIEGEKVKGQVSIPLANFMDTSLTRGRYLNGEAEFSASLSDGVLVVTLDSIEVNGEHFPEQLMADLRKKNLAKDAYENPENAKMIRRFESLQIKDGKIILKPRAREGSSTDSGNNSPPGTPPPPQEAEAVPAQAPEH
jgi:hypothetical protein